jgi:hypothetical protein
MSDEQTHRGERGSCRDCNAPILWVETENGKRMPLDADPERRFVIDAGTSPMRARTRNTYVCHLATCPKRATP